MRGVGRAATVLVVLLSGCFSQAQDPPEAVELESAPPAAEPFVGTCEGGILFQFVQYDTADDWLPPGFHTRDPQAFLSSPAAFGSAAVLVLMVECEAEDGRVMESASVDIFVQPPAVDGLEPGRFDFYEVERFADPGEFGGVLLPSGWPRLPGNVTLGGPTVVPGGDPGASVIANVADDQGTILSFFGPAAAPYPLIGEGTVRFWHERPAGLSYIEYQIDLQPLVGAGTCTARPGTAFAAIVWDLPADTGVSCPPGSPIVAKIAAMPVNVTARFLPGVHAG